MAGSQDVSVQHSMNSQQPINKLPPEILSQIFTLVVTHESGTGDEWGYHGVFASRVCSLWRDVAINDPIFWTRIHIASFSHQQLALLYLNRSGSRLIDVKLDLGKRYWDTIPIDARDHESQASHIQRMIDDLIGQHLQRCRSLRIYLACYETLAPFISMINENAAPALRFLLLEQEVIEGERMSVEPFPRGTNQPRSLSGLSLPRLEELHYSKLPGEYLFGSSATRFPSLTRLTLITGRGEQSKLTDRLPADRPLNLLSLGARASCKLLNLPSLHTLVLRSNDSAAWLLYAVRTIDVPNLHCLIMRSPRALDGGRLIREILDSVGPNPNPGQDPSARVLFPSLRELGISRHASLLRAMGPMFEALPQITHIRLSGAYEELFGDPRLLPNLVCIKFSPRDRDSSRSCSQLGRIVRSRAEAGRPIQTVQVPKSSRSQVEDVLPDTVEIQTWEDDLQL